MLLGACRWDSSASPIAPNPTDAIQAQPRQAWVGGGERVPYLLVEELSQPPHASATVGGEEALFRYTFSIAEDTRLLRVHVLNWDSAVDSPRGVLSAGNTLFHRLKNPPEDSSARARLYWYAVTRGVQEFRPGVPHQKHVSYLVAAEKTPVLDFEAPLQWHQGALSLDLKPRLWTEPERRAYLDAPRVFYDE